MVGGYFKASRILPSAGIFVLEKSCPLPLTE
jgi:hypothetical protein